MTIGSAKKQMIKHVMQVEGMAGGHARHDEQLCNYADAAAEDMYQQLIKELPSMVETIAVRIMKDNPYDIEVNQASLANVKTQITNLFKSIFG